MALGRSSSSSIIIDSDTSLSLPGLHRSKDADSYRLRNVPRAVRHAKTWESSELNKMSIYDTYASDTKREEHVPKRAIFLRHHLFFIFHLLDPAFDIVTSLLRLAFILQKKALYFCKTILPLR
jgi:hypothetical protein